MNRLWTRPVRDRSGFSLRRLLLVLSVLGILGLSAWPFFPRKFAQEADPMLVKVERGEFTHDITEHGDVESASNVEIRCEVQALGTSGTTILWILPEGTYVQPGDKLVELDKSSLEDSLVKQEIVCANSEAAVIQSTNDVACAKIALEEYVSGTLKQDLMAIENESLLAQENSNRAKDYATYSEKLAAKGFVTQVQLEADRFAEKKALKDLAMANKKKAILLEYTSAKMTRQLEANIKTAEARLLAVTDSHKLDTEKLELIKTQIEKCVIKAPEAGQVVYASQRDARGGNEIIIEEGALVRERQVIIRLPDPQRMQVTAKINEAKVSQVVVGMPCIIRMDAFPEVEMVGKVKKVSEYPAPTSWFNSHVKEYATVVSIDDPPPGLRPGLTAEVKIRVAQLPDVVQVPVQALFEHGGRHYCIVREGEGWKAQPVEIGRTNDKFVVIREGLAANQRVALNSAAYREHVDLPQLAPETKGKPSSATVARSGKKAAGDAAKTPAAGTAAEVAVAQAASEDSGGALFQRWDKNQDGKLQADELPEDLRSLFAAADVNHDGTLDRVELVAVMKHQGKPIASAQGTAGLPADARRGASQ